jgi:hypothetical protein
MALNLRLQDWLRLGGLLLGMAAAGCSRASVPATDLGVPDEVQVSGPGVDMAIEGAYAVVWVDSGGLPVRQPAGISGAVVETLPIATRDLFLTGETTQLGSSLWVEVLRPSGGTGWVNFWNLAESVPNRVACGDGRVAELAYRLAGAVQNRDGRALAGLLSPKRGLVYRHEWWNEEVILPIESVPGLFGSREILDWGLDPLGEARLEGTFEETVLPDFQEVLSAPFELSCGTLVSGETARPPEWPAEYRNLGMLVLFQAADSLESAFGWRALALAVEYFDGRPYVAASVPYRGEIGP